MRVAAYLPRPKRTLDGAAVLTLTGPRGAVYEALLGHRRGVAGATVTLPRRLARGRWQLAISDYARTVNATGRALIALSEFTVADKRKARGKR